MRKAILSKAVLFKILIPMYKYSLYFWVTQRIVMKGPIVHPDSNSRVSSVNVLKT